MIKYSINLAEFFCISEGTPGVMGDQGGGGEWLFVFSTAVRAKKIPQTVKTGMERKKEREIEMEGGEREKKRKR